KKSEEKITDVIKEGLILLEDIWINPAFNSKLVKLLNKETYQSMVILLSIRAILKNLPFRLSNEQDLNSIFEHFTPVNFYKRFDLLYLQRDLAEQKLREFLTGVATGSSKYKEKAKDILQNLHLSIKSRSVEEYWERTKMLKLKQQLDRTKKLKRLEEKTEILENITEARIAKHDIYNRELLQEMRNDSQAKYCDSELNHLERSQKREQLDNQRSPPDIAKDAKTKSRKRRSMKDIESKSAKPPKRNKSSKKIVVDAGQSTSVSSTDVQQTPSGTEDSIVDTTCDESESPVEINTTEKAE
ncbi:3229_t:CDS:2, partial [Funneliformis geosporum]